VPHPNVHEPMEPKILSTANRQRVKRWQCWDVLQCAVTKSEQNISSHVSSAAVMSVGHYKYFLYDLRKRSKVS
jgi:hypothetical protein